MAHSPHWLDHLQRNKSERKEKIMDSIDKIYDLLDNIEVTRENSREIENIKNIINNEKINCDFERQSSFVFTTNPSEVSQIKKEVDNEEELHLFDDSYEPTEKEQTALFNKIMSIMAEDGPDYTDEDRAWGTMMNRDISKNFIKKAFEEGHLPKLNFEGETNNQLMKDNLNFILDYMKR